MLDCERRIRIIDPEEHPLRANIRLLVPEFMSDFRIPCRLASLLMMLLAQHVSAGLISGAPVTLEKRADRDVACHEVLLSMTPGSPRLTPPVVQASDSGASMASVPNVVSSPDLAATDSRWSFIARTPDQRIAVCVSLDHPPLPCYELLKVPRLVS